MPTNGRAMEISEQEYFDNAVLMVAMCKAGVELAFEQMARPRFVHSDPCSMQMELTSHNECEVGAHRSTRIGRWHTA